MTDEKIINLAREYRQHANYPFEDITEAKLAAMDVIKWLSKTHCIVEKEEVRKLARLTIEEDYGDIDGLVDWVSDNFNDEYREEAEK